MTITLNQVWVNVGPMHCLTEKVGITFGICLVWWAKDVGQIITCTYTLGRRAKWRLVHNTANVMVTLDQSGMFLFFLNKSPFPPKTSKKNTEENKENVVLYSHCVMNHKNVYNALLPSIKNAPVTIEIHKRPCTSLEEETELFISVIFSPFHAEFRGHPLTFCR